MARNLGHTPEDKDHYEWNARVQITTWGNRTAADEGGLRDYAHKEWSGLLRDFYYKRWERYFDELSRQLAGAAPTAIDFYAMEENWVAGHGTTYPVLPEGDVVSVAQAVYGAIAQ